MEAPIKYSGQLRVCYHIILTDCYDELNRDLREKLGEEWEY
jgi:hypothetical protein